MRRLLLVLVLVGTAIGIASAPASAGGRSEAAKVAPTRAVISSAIDPQVAMGAHLFNRFACSACHGYFGQGGISKDVPALKKIVKVLTAAQLRSIINNGMGESKNPTKPYMPVWRGVISDTQINDLVAYLRAGLPAVPYARPLPVPVDQGPAVAGMILFQRYGCENCHGPNGLGGVPNPAAPDKVIPALSGNRFRKEFGDPQIIEMIRTGSVLGKGTIVSMPHWGGIIPDDKLADIVAYLKTFK